MGEQKNAVNRSTGATDRHAGRKTNQQVKRNGQKNTLNSAHAVLTPLRPRATPLCTTKTGPRSKDTRATSWPLRLYRRRTSIRTVSLHFRGLVAVSHQPSFESQCNFSPLIGLIVTGSLDSTALLWNPSIPDGPVSQLVRDRLCLLSRSLGHIWRSVCTDPSYSLLQTGHQNAVCGVHVMPGGSAILTTSWDRCDSLGSREVPGPPLAPSSCLTSNTSCSPYSTARHWTLDGTCTATLQGHEAAVWGYVSLLHYDVRFFFTL
jgi:WD40 repeat protein